MAELTFDDISSASAAVQAEVPKKVLCGLQTCQHVLAIQREAHELFSTVSRRARDIRRQTETIIPTITCPTGEMMGFLKAFEGLTSLVAAIAGSAETLSSTIEKEARQPLAGALDGLVQRKDSFLVRKISSSSEGGFNGLSSRVPPEIFISPVHEAPPPDMSRKRQKLYDRLLLANEEYQKAVESRDAIVNRFGSAIKPDLMQKIDERIKQAGHMKRQAEQKLREFDGDSPSV